MAAKDTQMVEYAKTDKYLMIQIIEVTSTSIRWVLYSCYIEADSHGGIA